LARQTERDGSVECLNGKPTCSEMGLFAVFELMVAELPNNKRESCPSRLRQPYNKDMARGWESKSVEAQIEDRIPPHQTKNPEQLFRREAHRKSRGPYLQLSRQRILKELEGSSNEPLFEMLRRAEGIGKGAGFGFLGTNLGGPFSADCPNLTRLSDCGHGSDGRVAHNAGEVTYAIPRNRRCLLRHFPGDGSNGLTAMVSEHKKEK